MKRKTLEKTSRPSIFYLDGGSGRVLCAIPALEYYALTHYNFSIMTSLKEEFFKENPILYKYAHSFNEEGLFDDIIKDGQMIMLEPYFRSEYYNQECSLIQAFDLEINGDYCIGDKAPKLYFSKNEEGDNKTNIHKIKEEYKCQGKPLLVFQPFGASASLFDDGVFDFTNRSFVMENIVDLIQLLRKDYLILWMGNLRLNISNHENPIVYVNDMSLREWAGYIKYADHFLGCDSVGQHMAKAVGTKSTIVIGSTYPINISYPNDDMVTIFDVGEARRVYEPIRITMDQKRSEKNQGIMLMGDKTLDNLVESIHTNCPISPTKLLTPVAADLPVISALTDHTQ
jgi:hypothetical protein